MDANKFEELYKIFKEKVYQLNDLFDYHWEVYNGYLYTENCGTILRTKLTEEKLEEIEDMSVYEMANTKFDWELF